MNSPSRQGAADLAALLAGRALSFCERYLSNGHADGDYWLVGDARGAPGGSMKVRLRPSGAWAAGSWYDYANGEHGDLLDILKLQLTDDRPAALYSAARAFLALPDPLTGARREKPRLASETASTAPAERAQRLYGYAKPLAGTLAARYLMSRAIPPMLAIGPVRFHPSCYYAADGLNDGQATPMPAMIAAATTRSGTLQAVHRTWLKPPGEKADLPEPRKALGPLTGAAVRWGRPSRVAIAGEGLETTLSLRSVFPRAYCMAALTSTNLGNLDLAGLAVLYVALDNDDAGRTALAKLQHRGAESQICIRALRAEGKDHNDDLQHFGRQICLSRLNLQIEPDHASALLR